MTSQSIKHLINEGEREVIFVDGLVKLAVIYANSPTGYHSCWNKLIVIILYKGNVTFFLYNLNKAQP